MFILCHTVTQTGQEEIGECVLCPMVAGALMKTSSGRFVHVICALYVQQTEIIDDDLMEPELGLIGARKI